MCLCACVQLNLESRMKTKSPDVKVHQCLSPLAELVVYLLQGVGLVAALVQQAVSRVGGDQGASGVGVVNGADVGSGAVRGSCGTEKKHICIYVKHLLSFRVNLQWMRILFVFDRRERSENTVKILVVLFLF